MRKRIFLMRPSIGHEEFDQIKKVLKSKFLTEGKVTQQFEQKIASYVHSKYAVALPKFYKRISSNLPPIIYGTGNQTRDFTYVEYTVDGIISSGEEPEAIEDTFNIGYGAEISIKKMRRKS